MNPTLIGVDIPRFGDPLRTDDVQRVLRHGLYEQMKDAFHATGVPWQACHHEDRGDGILIVIPPDVRAAEILGPLSQHLTAGLRRSNQAADSLCRLRMRIAVHAGEIHRDDYGLLGQPLILLYRLLNAPTFKAALENAPNADLGILVSDQLYKDVVTSGLIDPDAYQRLPIDHKETHTCGHLWLPQPPRTAMTSRRRADAPGGR
ncbi:hypothetical protein ACGFNU_50430 [Spirillospora sp. NPDC048911]|uniref:hypothetical protein n=1 Tax=Spirillospora sp. NPDC048911 TaxID=3364527 RepID=UPI0037178318